MQLDSTGTLLAQLLAAQVVVAPLLLLFIEEAGVMLMIPGDVILAFMGYQIAGTPHASLGLTMALVTLVVCGGASVLFFLSRAFGHKALTKFTQFIYVPQKRLLQAEKLFRKYGFWALLVGRHIPGLRLPLTILAGTSGMKYWQFLLSTFLSVVFWIILFMKVGHYVGNHFQGIFKHSVVNTVVAILLLVLVVLSLHVIGKRRAKPKA